MSDRMAKIIAAGEADAEAFRAEERAAVVAWLRGGEAAYRQRAERALRKGWANSAKEFERTAEHYQCIAECIEARDHLKDTPA